jgi:hypothetical protein
VPRAISIRHTVVPVGDKAEFRARARQSRDHYVGHGCHYWLFEESRLPGAYVEFFEAKDRETLVRAHGDAPISGLESGRLYTEVELS